MKIKDSHSSIENKNRVHINEPILINLNTATKSGYNGSRDFSENTDMRGHFFQTVAKTK